MTKEEILQKVFNHKSEISETYESLVTTLRSLTKGYLSAFLPAQEQKDVINALKHSVEFIVTKSGEIKDLLDEWPDQ